MTRKTELAAIFAKFLRQPEMAQAETLEDELLSKVDELAGLLRKEEFLSLVLEALGDDEMLEELLRSVSLQIGLAHGLDQAAKDRSAGYSELVRQRDTSQTEAVREIIRGLPAPDRLFGDLKNLGLGPAERPERDMPSVVALEQLREDPEVGGGVARWLDLAECGIGPLRLFDAWQALDNLRFRLNLAEEAEPSDEQKIEAIRGATGWSAKVAEAVLRSGMLQYLPPKPTPLSQPQPENSATPNSAPGVNDPATPFEPQRDWIAKLFAARSAAEAPVALELGGLQEAAATFCTFYPSARTWLERLFAALCKRSEFRIALAPGLAEQSARSSAPAQPESELLAPDWLVDWSLEAPAEPGEEECRFAEARLQAASPRLRKLIAELHRAWNAPDRGRLPDSHELLRGALGSGDSAAVSLAAFAIAAEDKIGYVPELAGALERAAAGTSTTSPWLTDALVLCLARLLRPRRDWQPSREAVDALRRVASQRTLPGGWHRALLALAACSDAASREGFKTFLAELESCLDGEAAAAALERATLANFAYLVTRLASATDVGFLQSFLKEKCQVAQRLERRAQMCAVEKTPACLSILESKRSTRQLYSLKISFGRRSRVLHIVKNDDTVLRYWFAAYFRAKDQGIAPGSANFFRESVALH